MKAGKPMEGGHGGKIEDNLWKTDIEAELQKCLACWTHDSTVEGSFPTDPLLLLELALEKKFTCILLRSPNDYLS